MAYALRDYQQAAVDATLSHFRKDRSPALIVLPTGAGKSLVIAELARVARGRVLVLAHVKELVEQNYQKYCSYGLQAGIFSAGLERRDQNQKVIFGSIQSVVNAQAEFFADFSLLIIDECHRVALNDPSTQYHQAITKLIKQNPRICVLGLTATPYRLESGWIYHYSSEGKIRQSSPEAVFFKKCVYELSLEYLIAQKYLTPAIKIERPVAAYDFSKLNLLGRRYSADEIEDLLTDQARITPVIVQNIVDLAEARKGVMIFCSSVKHARSVLSKLPPESAALITGKLAAVERDQIINEFKRQNIKFLVNVSVLTTGFDAPHVDLIAILRPTESVALYQQIVGRGLRLSPGKKDCLVLDFASNQLDLFTPKITQSKPAADAVPVKVDCPSCKTANDFWGITDAENNVLEHFGTTCAAATETAAGEINTCGYRFRSRFCPECSADNDYQAEQCADCGSELKSFRETLANARKDKMSHVMSPNHMEFASTLDRRGKERLEITYYDFDANQLKEYFYLNSTEDWEKFYYNFLRMHLRKPELQPTFSSAEQLIAESKYLKTPLYLIARKQKYFWQVQEKIFW